MLREHKNPSTELSTDTRELIAHLVGPLHTAFSLTRILGQVSKRCLGRCGMVWIVRLRVRSETQIHSRSGMPSS